MLPGEVVQVAEEGAGFVEFCGVGMDVANAPGAVFLREEDGHFSGLTGVLGFRSPSHEEIHACRGVLRFGSENLERSRRIPGGEESAIVWAVNFFVGMRFRRFSKIASPELGTLRN